MASRRRRPRASVTVGPSGRILALSAAWFSDGAERRARARRERTCVECAAPLTSGRSPYCSRNCQWKFHGHYFWDSARIYVKRRDRYICRSCRRRFRSHELEVDHIVEIARGGAALEYANLQTLCRTCHRAKTVLFFSARRHDPSEVDRVPSPPSRRADALNEDPPNPGGGPPPRGA